VVARISRRDYQRIVKASPRPLKYRNKPTVVDGIRFDSKFEATVYGQLVMRQKAGEIRNLKRQVRFPLLVNNQKVGVLIADFTYEERDGPYQMLFGTDYHWHMVIADAKSPITRRQQLYRLKNRIMQAMGTPITEIVSR